jgi:hypothetical protein
MLYFRRSYHFLVLVLILALGLATSASAGAGEFSDLKKDDIFKVVIMKLHPLQPNLGKAEADARRKEFENMSVQDLKDYLKAHPVPVVIGPAGEPPPDDVRPYILDEHHRADAALGAEATDMVLHKKAMEMLLKHGERAMYAEVIENDSHMNMEEFQARLEEMHWVLLETHGRKITFDQLPDNVTEMGDDAYRSLAGFTENLGWKTKKKKTVYFEQFEVADWLRETLKLPDAEINERLKPQNRDEFVSTVAKIMKSDLAVSEPWYIGKKRDRYLGKKGHCLTDGVKQLLKGN